MDENIAIKCSHIYKRYPLYHGDFQRLKGLILPVTAEILRAADINLFSGRAKYPNHRTHGSGNRPLQDYNRITYPTKEPGVFGDVNMLSANAGMESSYWCQKHRYKCLLMGFKKGTYAIQDDIIAFDIAIIY